MVYLEEKVSKKVSGETSLFISFKYNERIVTALKNIGGCVYNPKEKIWESALFNLAQIINELSEYDDIQLNLLPDKKAVKKETEPKFKTTFKTSPYEYQLEGIKYGLNHDKWLLLDSPGLGKTLQLIYIAQELKARKEIKHCLIICGVNTLKSNWKKEIEKHSNLSCKILGERTTKTGNTVIGSVKDRCDDILSKPEEFFWITNIETIRSNDVVKALNKVAVDMIAVDEIHVTKSPTSQQGKNLLKLNKSKYQVGMTGTLLLNNPLDCYVPLKWIGKEKSNYTTFKGEYIKYGGLFNNEIVGYRNVDFLKSLIEESSIRRTKDILGLPPKTIIDEYIDLNDEHRKFYDDIKKGVKNSVDKVKLNSVSLLSLLTRLRQAIACPSILTSEQIEPTKINRVCELCDDIISNNNKVVIYSTYKQTVQELEERLKKYNPLIITGDIKDEVVSKNIDKFQTDDKYKVCICTWQKAGTGITLTAARYAIFVDCSYTPAQNEQAEDRIHRISTKEPVFIYYIWANNTIDNRIKEILEDKSLINEYVIDDKISPLLFEKLRQIIDLL